MSETPVEYKVDPCPIPYAPYNALKAWAMAKVAIAFIKKEKGISDEKASIFLAQKINEIFKSFNEKQLRKIAFAMDQLNQKDYELYCACFADPELEKQFLEKLAKGEL